MTIHKKEEFENRLKEAIQKDKWFEGLVIKVKAIEQLGDPSHPNNVRFEVYVLINGYVEGLECMDQENDSLPALTLDEARELEMLLKAQRNNQTLPDNEPKGA